MKLFSTTPQQTEDIAARLGSAVFPGAVIALWGDLGAGKTAFVRGLARGMGVSGRVHSPTFAIVREHNGPTPLFHFDLYRLEDGLADSGLDEYFYRGGVCALEWPQMAQDELPAERLDIYLRPAGEGRELEFCPIGQQYLQLMEKFA